MGDSHLRRHQRREKWIFCIPDAASRDLGGERMQHGGHGAYAEDVHGHLGLLHEQVDPVIAVEQDRDAALGQHRARDDRGHELHDAPQPSPADPVAGQRERNNARTDAVEDTPLR
jgi:hypothetical protein